MPEKGASTKTGHVLCQRDRSNAERDFLERDKSRGVVLLKCSANGMLSEGVGEEDSVDDKIDKVGESWAASTSSGKDSRMLDNSISLLQALPTVFAGVVDTEDPVTSRFIKSNNPSRDATDINVPDVQLYLGRHLGEERKLLQDQGLARLNRDRGDGIFNVFDHWGY